jgi:hypothetical protein
LKAARGRFGAAADVQIDRLATLAVPDRSGPIAQDVLRLLTASAAAPGDDPALRPRPRRPWPPWPMLEQAQRDGRECTGSGAGHGPLHRSQVSARKQRRILCDMTISMDFGFEKA